MVNTEAYILATSIFRLRPDYVSNRLIKVFTIHMDKLCV